MYIGFVEKSFNFTLRHHFAPHPRIPNHMNQKSATTVSSFKRNLQTYIYKLSFMFKVFGYLLKLVLVSLIYFKVKYNYKVDV